MMFFSPTVADRRSDSGISISGPNKPRIYTPRRSRARYFLPTAKCFLSEFRDFGKVEPVHLHCRHHHVKGFLPAGADGRAHLLNIREHLNQALIKAEIPDSTCDFSVFHQKGAIASHPSQDFFVWIDFADVPESRDQNPALRRGDHLVHSIRVTRRLEDNVHGRFAHFVRNRKAMSGSFDRADFARVFRLLHLFCARPRVHQPFDDSAFDELDPLAAHAFAIEGRAGLEWMRDVVPDCDVFAEQTGTNAVAEKRPLIENGKPAEVV